MRPGDVVAAMWQAMQDRHWAAVRAVLADDLVVEWPASGERIVGAERVAGFNAAYPEGWTIDVPRLVEDGDVVVSEVGVPHVDVGVFGTVGSGRCATAGSSTVASTGSGSARTPPRNGAPYLQRMPG